jgi:hypothetical protein
MNLIGRCAFRDGSTHVDVAIVRYGAGNAIVENRKNGAPLRTKLRTLMSLK